TDIIKETNTDKIKTEKSYGNHHHVSKLSFISEQKGLSFDKIIGQLFETYIIAQNNKSFYLIDQHAAHEKILYEKQIAKQESDSIATQQLITPYTMQLSIKEVMFLEEHISLFKDIGFEVSVFGRDTILIREVPYISGKAVSPILLRKILDDVIDGGKGDDPLAKEKMAASVACHAAIKAGETLSMSEMRELLSQLEELKAPYTCPHGRPTIICISLYEIEKKFKRVQ
ncbi:MAG: DNA mismatch repair protein MutL, partial [Thermoanaerobacterales bacterium]|nr:DNA mismatch repair protein MutL [Thermoanaerobacterales bacterium]